MVDKYKLISGILFTTLWIQLCWGFLCTDVAPALGKSLNYINLLFDGVYVVLGFSVIRARRDMIVFLSFIAIASVSAFLNHQSVLEFFNGFREFLGLLFAAPVIRYMLNSYGSERFVRSFDKQLYIFLWIQLVCIVSQFIRFGAGDHGGGSLGFRGSGAISTLIYVVSFYLMSKRWDEKDSYFQNLWANRTLIFLLLPTFLNETKASFIYFFAYFFLLMRVDRTFVLRAMMALPVAVVMFFCVGYLYVTATDTKDMSYDEDFFMEYLIGEDMDNLMELAILVQEEEIETENLWVVDLPRFGRFMLLPENMKSAGGGLILGAGIGQFKGGSIVQLSPFAKKFNWFLRGSLTMLFFILVELGIVGLVWMLYTMYSLIFTRDERPRGPNLKFYMTIVLTLVFVYISSMLDWYFCFIISYICLRGLQPQVDDGSQRMELSNG